MTITLITPEEHAWLLFVQKEFPALTFENNGYQYIDKSKFTEEEKQKFNEVEAFLKKSIKGFHEFNNFKIRKNGQVVVRFQYSWTADEENPRTSFTGVGYIEVDELLNGFNKKDKDE